MTFRRAKKPIRNRPMTFPRLTTRLLLGSLLLLSLLVSHQGGVAPARGAEIVFRANCVPEGDLVYLRDVADVYAADASEAKQLQDIELFPAPVPGEPRYVQAREIQDLLWRRGVPTKGHRFSGASRLKLEARKAPPPAVQAKVHPRVTSVVRPTIRPLSKALRRRAENQTRDAIVEFLSRNVASDEPWIVEAPLNEDQARSVEQAAKVSVAKAQRTPQRGDVLSWTGSQQFLLQVDAEGAPGQFVVRAQVSLPPMVVVAATSLPTGAVIRKDQLRLERASLLQIDRALLGRIEDVVGREAARSISAGQAIDAQMIREPLLVRRGETVTVYVRAAGVRVRTLARAKEPGSRGQPIEVQSLSDRRTYFAVVSGPGVVEVYARSVRATGQESQRGSVRR